MNRVKYLGVIILFLLSSVAFGNKNHKEKDKETVKVETVSKAKSSSQLKAVAEELNVSEEKAFETLVQQQRVQAIRNLMIFFTMFMSMWTIKRLFRSSSTEKEVHDNSDLLIKYYEARKSYDITFGREDSYRRPDPPASPLSVAKKEVIEDTVRIRFIILLTLSLLIFIASIIYNSVMLQETFTGLFNPEYGALQELKFFIEK